MEALGASFGAGILGGGVWGCGPEVEGLVEDFVDEDGGGEGRRVGFA